MRIAVYGGSFNPPHIGHAEAALSVYRELLPDIFLIIPDNIPPHKDMAAGSPTAEQRMELCRLAFRNIPGAQVSDMELRRSGRSYTADTVAQLRERYPEDQLILVMGSDMLLSFEKWYRFEYLLENCALAVVSREEGDLPELRKQAEYLRAKYGAEVTLLRQEPLPAQSSELRELLRLRKGVELLDDAVYSCIIKNGWYEALPELSWLRGKAYQYLDSRRVGHVVGCESEAVRLAMHWGELPERAATAAILHDITKRLNFEEQLHLCEEYGMICSNAELAHPRILHAITGAGLARELFGVSEAISEAIRWHTTGKPDMTLLEKILYLADYIEPTRDFPGVEGPRELAYRDIDRALALALKNTLDELKELGEEPFEATAEAYRWYSREI